MREAPPISRRSFIKLAATAGAAAALPGCEPAARKLIPYVVPDENVVPGMPSFFATTCAECPAGCGVVARIREGRAIKLEGNPADPIGQGALCARGQAALQGLYNPDRLAHPKLRGSDGVLREVSWDDAEKMLAERLAAASKVGKDRVAFFGAPGGPTLAKIAQAFVGAYDSSRAIFYEAINQEAARQAAKTLFGRRDLPIYRIDQAEVLISFGADFLETWQSPVELARQYAIFRTPQKRGGALTIGRASYVGPRLSVTASKCDEWIATAPGAQADVAWSVLNVLVKGGMVSPNSGFDLTALGKAVENFDPAATSARTGVPAETITRLGEAFGKANGALAIAGTDDSSAHLAAMILNAVTGNFGKTIMFLEGAPAEETSTPDEVDAAIDAMRGGEINTVFIARANPVFTMPPSARVAEALQKVAFVVWAGEVPDETAAMANLLLPAHHPLESWRDTAPRAGIRGLGQPVMQPVFASKAVGDILLAAAAKSSGAKPQWATTADAVKAEWMALAPKADNANPEDFWVSVRREGGLFEEQHLSPLKLDTSPFKGAVPTAPQMELSVYTYPHIFLYDGRGADKPWLQELPEPVTQIVWDSWAEIHPETARKLGVARDDLIEIKTEHGTIEAPVLVERTVRQGVIAVPLGQGHRAYGRYAKGVGANAWTILPAGATYAAVTARPTGGKRALVSPLGNSDMLGRSIVEAMSLEDLAKGEEPKDTEPDVGPYEFYPDWKYPVHQWGMTIDVNACTGCSACVTACYAENNLPLVGKDGVDNGRIMSWIRVERYFPSEKEAPHAPLLYTMPMLCQQCHHAPCEPVCPVFASYHTQEGLNGQIYNRCVGTRYCENNCPYKVRRFNWFKPEWPEPLNLQLNPDVTVRGAGVMEKCTFCVQRIQFAEISARIEGRQLRDGEIQTACQQACPSRAITFGDINDPGSAMMRRRDDNKLRDYLSLKELNTQPAITYLRDIYREKGKA